MHAQLVTRAIHVTHAQQPVETSDATGAQRLLHAAASFRPTTAHLAELVTTVHHALSIVTHAQRAIHAMVERLVVSKTVRLALLTVTHVRLVTTVPRELSIVTHVTRTSLAQPVLSAAQPLLGARVTHVRLAMTVHHALSIVTHAQRVTRVTVEHLVVSKTAQLELSIVTHAQRAMVTHARQELSTAQNLAAHASSTTDHASLTATTATTAPTVVQTALTVSTATATVTAPSKVHARATQTRRPSLKTRSLSVSRA
jgi:hypothetical protein